MKRSARPSARSVRGPRGGARVGAGRPREAATADLALEACVGLLEKHGYDGLTIDDVARVAGVAKTTIYRRWPSKAALVGAAVEPLYAQTLEAPDTGSLREDLLIMLEGTRGQWTGRAGRVLQILVRAAGEHPEVNEPLQCGLYRRRSLYEKVLNRGIARGEIRADIDHDLVTDLLHGPFWIRALVRPAPILRELVAQIVDSVLEGITTVA